MVGFYMAFGGKIFGTFLGMPFLPPFGSVFGFFVGHLYDIGFFHRFFMQRVTEHTQQRGYSSVQQLFFDVSFSVMGFIAKSDGRVSELEIQMAERIMQEMGLQGERRKHAIAQFNLGKQADFDYQSELERLRQVGWFQPGLIRLFLDIQVQIALANGVLRPGSRQALRSVFLGLGYSSQMYERYERQFFEEHREQSGDYHSGAYQARSSERTLDEEYALLGVSPQVTSAELKKAYRRMMSKHHPDRLIAQGVPPEMIKLATQKTQQIKQAYERLKVERRLA